MQTASLWRLCLQTAKGENDQNDLLGVLQLQDHLVGGFKTSEWQRHWVGFIELMNRARRKKGKCWDMLKPPTSHIVVLQKPSQTARKGPTGKGAQAGHLMPFYDQVQWKSIGKWLTAQWCLWTLQHDTWRENPEKSSKLQVSFKIPCKFNFFS